MTELCGDNRFETIEKAKQKLLEDTNISSSPDEMKVLDSFLFRCWQMGWLDEKDAKFSIMEEKLEETERLLSRAFQIIGEVLDR